MEASLVLAEGSLVSRWGQISPRKLLSHQGQSGRPGALTWEFVGGRLAGGPAGAVLGGSEIIAVFIVLNNNKAMVMIVLFTTRKLPIFTSNNNVKTYLSSDNNIDNSH